jgi:uncharacterized membrane protein YfcA
MGPLDATWHLLNFFAPALGVGLLAALATKLLWRRELGAVRWQRLAAFACAGGALASIGGLVVFGCDGRMGTYALLVLASAAALWWAAFGPRRK